MWKFEEIINIHGCHAHWVCCSKKPFENVEWKAKRFTFSEKSDVVLIHLNNLKALGSRNESPTIKRSTGKPIHCKARCKLSEWATGDGNSILPRCLKVQRSFGDNSVPFHSHPSERLIWVNQEHLLRFSARNYPPKETSRKYILDSIAVRGF